MNEIDGYGLVWDPAICKTAYMEVVPNTLYFNYTSEFLGHNPLVNEQLVGLTAITGLFGGEWILVSGTLLCSFWLASFHQELAFKEVTCSHDGYRFSTTYLLGVYWSMTVKKRAALFLLSYPSPLEMVLDSFLSSNVSELLMSSVRIQLMPASTEAVIPVRCLLLSHSKLWGSTLHYSKRRWEMRQRLHCPSFYLVQSWVFSISRQFL